MANLFPQTVQCPKCGHTYFAKEDVVSFVKDPGTGLGAREVEMSRNSYRCLYCGANFTTMELYGG